MIHFTLLCLALAQRPACDLDREILARADISGCTHAFTSDCREANIRFSVGYEVDERVCAAILELPKPRGCRRSTPTARTGTALGSRS